MSAVENDVLLNVKVHDASTKVLGGIASAAGKVSHRFDEASKHIGEMGLAAAAMIAGFGIKEVLSETIDHLSAVKRIGKLSEISAGQAEALVEVFDNVGVKIEDSERMLGSLSKKGAKLDMIMQATGKSTNTTSVMFAQLGINTKKGLVNVIEQIAEGVKSGKIHAVELSTAFNMPVAKAMLLEKALSKGKQAITDAQKEQMKHGIAVKKNMEFLDRYKSAQIKMKDGWEKIKLKIGAALLPVVTQLMEYGANNMERWLDSATKFATTLSDFIGRFQGALITVGKILIANYTISKLTGKSIGGWSASAIKGGRALIAKSAAKTAAAGIGTVAEGGAAAAFTAAFPKFIAGAGGAAAGGIGAAITAALTPVLVVVAALAVVGVAIWATWKAISQNLDGVKTTMLALWERISIHVEAISSQIQKTFGPLLSSVQKIFGKTGISGKFFLTLIPKMINQQLAHLEKFLMMIRVVDKFVSKIKDGAALLWAEWMGKAKKYMDSAGDFFKDIGAWLTDIGQGLWNKLLPAIELFKEIGAWLSDLGTQLKKLIEESFDWLSKRFKTVSDFFNPVIEKLIKVTKALEDFLTPLIDRFIKPVKETGALEDFLTPLIDRFIKPVKETGANVIGLAQMSYMEVELETQREQLRRRQEELAALRAKLKPPDDRAGTTNNFPDARFNITQKFAEGFDPDRIAIAFSRDVAAMGERKLQSGFSPVFGV